MPDTRRHRGPHPQDSRLFADDTHPLLQDAVRHLSWLLTRGYAARSALKLVGDRFALVERQRRAVMRSACSDPSREDRAARQVMPHDVQGERLTIDGFNLLTTIEAGLSGGVLLLGRDGCLRDMASMHGSYRRVTETLPALHVIGECCEHLKVERCRWWLDQPVSNSGRLRTVMLKLAEERGWSWDVELLPDPDRPLQQSTDIIVTSDAAVLDRGGRWFNLAWEIVSQWGGPIRLYDFRDDGTA